jgi:hypothetical protein
MKEKWKRLKFNRNIAISNFGRLKSIKNDLVWRLRIGRQGYVDITLYVLKSKRSKSFKIHRLVAEYFLPKVECKNQVNHKDFNKQNNHVSNLEWCTMKENAAHYFKNKFKYVVTDDQVKFIRQNIESIGAAKMAKMLNIKQGYILGVANGIHRPLVHPELIRAKKTSLPKPVIQFNENGEKVGEYPSILAAAKANKVKLSKVQRVLYGERKTHNGFSYRYA